MNDALNVLVTGANGFIGRALCKKLLNAGCHVRGAVRSLEASRNLPAEVERVVTGEIGPETDWTEALRGIDAVVHLAARVHVFNEVGAECLKKYRSVNAAGTERLARSAASRKLRRLVYISTIKVNGEKTTEHAFTSDDIPRPENPYAISKWEAEESLRRISRGTEFEYVIVRPPLVYGPGVRANFLRLLRWVDEGKPLPFASVKNCRSLIGLSNMIDFISLCLRHPGAANRVFLVADGESISTPDLIRILASTLGKKPRLFPCPPAVLKCAAGMVGKKQEYERLTGSLHIDTSTARKVLGWEPPFTLSEEIGETVKWYRSNEENL